MKDQECQILTVPQALTAIYLDFERYEPQTMLFCEVIRTVLEDQAAVSRKPGDAGAWVRSSGSRSLRFLQGPELANHVCQLLASAEWTAQKVAALCSRVFQTSARTITDPLSGQTLIRIPTDMQAYTCHHCGHCCRSLNYHDAVTAEDLSFWHSQKRNDILKWVGVTRAGDQGEAYRIWVIPGTNQFAPVCPFLQRTPAKGQWCCTIHEAKPEICRQYPLSRKHALMTGCRGFDR